MNNYEITNYKPVVNSICAGLVTASVSFLSNNVQALPQNKNTRLNINNTRYISQTVSSTYDSNRSSITGEFNNITDSFIDKNGLYYEVYKSMSIAKDSFSSIKFLSISFESDPEIENYGWVSIDLVVDSDVNRFLEEYNNYSKIFAETIPLEKMDLIHLNYSFA